MSHAEITNVRLMGDSKSDSDFREIRFITVSLRNDKYDSTDQNSNVLNLQVQSLPSNHEQVIQQWTKFCRTSFAFKKNPPSQEYFARHYYNDPLRDYRLIRTIVISPSFSNPTNNTNEKQFAIQQQTEEQTIVSTLRMFRRTISASLPDSLDTTSNFNEVQPHLHSIQAGGIGEVCTAVSYQKLGLAKTLLCDAIQMMEDTKDLNMDVSFLHVSGSLAPFYERCGGYTHVTHYWYMVQIDTTRLHHMGPDRNVNPSGTNHHGKYSSKYTIRRAQFPNDTPHLQRIHQIYSEDRFFGCIRRDVNYWNDYLSQEIGHSFFLFTVTNPVEKKPPQEKQQNQEPGEDDDNDIIYAWISIQPRNEGEYYQIREFGIDRKVEDHCGISMEHAFCVLLQHAFLMQMNTTVAMELKPKMVVHIPAFLLYDMYHQPSSLPHIGWDELNQSPPLPFHAIFQWIDTLSEANDHGWMYRILNPKKRVRTLPQESLLKQILQLPNHFIWPSDSF